jgi:hypothetical protein
LTIGGHVWHRIIVIAVAATLVIGTLVAIDAPVLPLRSIVRRVTSDMSCQRHNDISDLPGTYTGGHGGDRVMLSIMDNGTFDEIYIRPSGEHFKILEIGMYCRLQTAFR